MGLWKRLLVHVCLDGAKAEVLTGDLEEEMHNRVGASA